MNIPNDIKYVEELKYWRDRYDAENNRFDNSHYKKLMLSILDIDNISIFDDRVVADFGCGPRGSLSWIDNSRVNLGLDVLVPLYMDNFSSELNTHNMVYVTTSEYHIPVQSNFVDLLFTINSFDHVNNAERMSDEIFRIMKKGAIFAASFNLHEPASLCEPQSLSMELIRRFFIRRLDNVKIRIAHKANPAYDNFFANNVLAKVDPTRPCIAWLTGTRK